MGFVKKLASRMGWTVSEAKVTDHLYDPETKAYLNDETMQAIRDVEAGNVTRCKDMNELLALVSRRKNPSVEISRSSSDR